MKAEMKYDGSSRIKEVKTYPESITRYEYRDSQSSEPYKVIIPTGGAFVFNRNSECALEYIMTPRGHIHGFSTQFSLGFQRFSYLSPWTRHPYEEHIDHRGRLVARVWPEQSAKMVYVYDTSSGLLKYIVGGTSSVSYGYIGGTNLLKSIQVSEEDQFRFGMKIQMRYHFGLLKDSKTSFDKDDKLVLDNVYTKYSYDGSARIAGIITQIGR